MLKQLRPNSGFVGGLSVVLKFSLHNILTFIRCSTSTCPCSLLTRCGTSFNVQQYVKLVNIFKERTMKLFLYALFTFEFIGMLSFSTVGSALAHCRVIFFFLLLFLLIIEPETQILSCSLLPETWPFALIVTLKVRKAH